MRKTIVAVLFGVVCSSHFMPGASAQPLAVPIPQQEDSVLKGLTIPASAPSIGMWSPPPAANPQYNWPLVAMHSAVMPDGKVVTFGSPLDTSPFATKGEVFDIWNPKRGFTANSAVSHRALANIPAVDSFCAASLLLSSGNLLTSGGNTRYPDDSWNNATSVLNSVRLTTSGATRMASSRYYATQTMLADGRLLITGGTAHGADATWSYNDNPGPWGQMSGAPEVYTTGPSGGSWDTLTGAGSVSPVGAADAFGPRDNKWWYPRQWVAPADGKVFGISTHQMWYLDPAVQPGGAKGSITLLNAFKSGVGTMDRSSAPNVGPTSTAVMYDTGKILQVGGNGRLNGDTLFPDHDWTPSSNAASIFDINTAGQVQWRDTNPVFYWRQWANATVLPNGKVVVTGGTGTGNKTTPDTPNEPGLGPIHHAEIWDPVTEHWTLGPPASVARVYHSTAVLLPNGTVLTAGSGGPVGLPPESPAQYNAEVYYPAYLFQTVNNVPVLATRPRILSMNARKFSHGAELRAQVSVSAQDITKAVLIGLGAVTHSFDMGQRLYPVPTLSKSGTQVWFSIPDANKTPPGYYYLFVLQNGVPSDGVIVAIGSEVTRPPLHDKKVTVDWDGDRRTDLTIFRPSTTIWWVRYTATGGSNSFEWGQATDVPRVMDFDGDDNGDIAVWRPSIGRWYIRTSSTNYSMAAATEVEWGISGDIPVPADYDADGRSDVAIWRPSTGVWWIRFADGSSVTRTWGVPGDVPRPMDFDGDGLMDLAVFRPSTGYWWICKSSNNYSLTSYDTVEWGTSGDIPVPADYDGDGRTDLAMWRPWTYEWLIRDTLTGGWSTRVWGTSGDLPRAIDYDGDGAADLAVWRPATGVWHIRTSSSNYSNHIAVEWGTPGDVPIGDMF